MNAFESFDALVSSGFRWIPRVASAGLKPRFRSDPDVPPVEEDYNSAFDITVTREMMMTLKVSGSRVVLQHPCIILVRRICCRLVRNCFPGYCCTSSCRACFAGPPTTLLGWFVVRTSLSATIYYRHSPSLQIAASLLSCPRRFCVPTTDMNSARHADIRLRHPMMCKK